MRILVSGCTVTVAQQYALRPDRLGVLLTPSSGNRVPAAMPFGCDNDCFAGLDAPKYLRFLAKLSAAGRKPAWVTCPDKVGDMAETWRLYDVWAPLLRSLELPVALALQDGLELFKWRARLPSVWADLAAVFVGGSTAFKEGPTARDICREAKRNGLLVHVGRVNTRRRIRLLARWGCVDTIDGRNWSAWGGKKIPQGVKWIDGALSSARQQPDLFTEAA